MGCEKSPLVHGVRHSIGRLLPLGWNVEIYRSVSAAGREEIDLSLVGPGGRTIVFDVFFDDGGSGPDELKEDLCCFIKDIWRPVLVLADGMRHEVRAMLDRERINYADTAGWVSITCGSPLVVLRSTGCR